MSHQVKGVVDQLTQKTVTTKFGEKSVYGVIIDGVEVSTGFKKEHAEGEMVSLLAEWKFNNWQKLGNGGDGLPAATAGGPMGGTGTGATGVTKGAFTPKGGSRSFPVQPTDGQMSIIRQNSMNRAVEILDQWMSPDMDGNTLFNPATEDEYLRKLMEVALTITDFNSGQDIMKLQAQIANTVAANG